MKAVKKNLKIQYVSPETATLITELRDECQQIVKLVGQLEIAGLAKDRVEDILGQLSAAILHLHEHTRDLDDCLDEDEGA